MKQNHALAVLIDETRAANKWSDQDVADRASKSGYKLSKSNISRIRNSPVVALNIDTVSALADGLGIPKSVVAFAALASMGIVALDSGQLTADAAIRRDPTLTAQNKTHLLALLSSMRESHPGSTSPTETNFKEVVGNGGHPTHMNQAGESPATDSTTVSRDLMGHFRSKEDNAKGKKIPYVDPNAHPDADEFGRIPLPANYFDLAASGHRNLGSEEAARASARGEETQDTEQDN